jgi:hypothetical protein
MPGSRVQNRWRNDNAWPRLVRLDKGWSYLVVRRLESTSLDTLTAGRVSAGPVTAIGMFDAQAQLLHAALGVTARVRIPGWRRASGRRTMIETPIHRS